MTRWRWFVDPDLINEFDRMGRDLSRLFQGLGTAFDRGEWQDFAARAAGTAGGVFPPLNIYDDGESLVVRAEIPGIDPKTLDVMVTDDTLTLKGERPKDPVEDGVSYHRRERESGTFHRSVTLPEAINGDKVMAHYEHGILEVRLPKAETARPRKVEIR